MLAYTEEHRDSAVALGHHLPKQLMKQFVAVNAMMRRNAGQDGGECPDLQRVMVRKGDVMLALNCAG
jgi:hypothetical protein